MRPLRRVPGNFLRISQTDYGPIIGMNLRLHLEHLPISVCHVPHTHIALTLSISKAMAENDNTVLAGQGQPAQGAVETFGDKYDVTYKSANLESKEAVTSKQWHRPDRCQSLARQRVQRGRLSRGGRATRRRLLVLDVRDHRGHGQAL